MTVPLPNGAQVFVKKLSALEPVADEWLDPAGLIPVRRASGLGSSGGAEEIAANKLLGEYYEQRKPVGRSYPDFTFSYEEAPESAHHILIKEARDERVSIALKIQMRSGKFKMFVGHPSGSLVPTMDRDSIMTVTVSVMCVMEQIDG